MNEHVASVAGIAKDMIEFIEISKSFFNFSTAGSSLEINKGYDLQRSPEIQFKSNISVLM